MTTRRTVLKGMSTAALCTLMNAKADAKDLDALCLLRAKQLGEAMKELHGGVWRVSIDKDFVLISKTRVSQPQKEPSEL